MRMRLMLLGGGNALGQALIRLGAEEDIGFLAPRPPSQGWDAPSLTTLLDDNRPDIVINLAYYFDWFQSGRVDETALTTLLTVTGQYHVQPIAFARAHRTQDRNQLLADRTGGRQEKQQRGRLAFCPDREPATVQAVQRELRRGLAHLGPRLVHQRAHRRNALVEHPDLAREHDEAETQNHHGEGEHGEREIDGGHDDRASEVFRY